MGKQADETKAKRQAEKKRQQANPGRLTTGPGFHDPMTQQPEPRIDSVTVTADHIEKNQWPRWLRPALVASDASSVTVRSATGIVDVPVGSNIRRRDNQIMV